MKVSERIGRIQESLEKNIDPLIRAKDSEAVETLVRMLTEIRQELYEERCYAAGRSKEEIVLAVISREAELDFCNKVLNCLANPAGYKEKQSTALEWMRQKIKEFNQALPRWAPSRFRING